MTIKNIECADCGAPVPYGRLACPSCGALLAAVAGGPPPAVRVVETPSPEAADTAGQEAAPPAPKSRARGTPRTTPKEPVTREHAGKASAGNGVTKPPTPAAKPAPPAAAPKPARTEPPASDPVAATASATVSPAPVERSSTSSTPVAAQLAYLVEPSPDAPQYVIPAAPVAAAAAVERAAPVPAGAVNGRSHVATSDAPANGRTTYLEPEPPIQGSSGYVINDHYRVEDDDDDAPASPWPPLLQPEPTILARPYGAPANGTDPGSRPGAYLPPNTPAGGHPASPPLATARDSTSSTAGPLPPADLAVAGGAGGAAAVVATKGSPRFDPAATISAAFAGIDRARVAEVAGWFVVAGSTVAMLGFLLPWSVVVIGSNGTGGYLDDWGLASPTHLFAVLGLAGVLALGVLQNPVPAWLRTGVLGLLSGGLLVGLTWPYAIGPLGAELGAMATFVGGLLLLGGGLVATWATRHVEADPVV